MAQIRLWTVAGLLLATSTALACIVIPPPPPPPPAPPSPTYLDVHEQHITLSFEHPVVRTKVETELYNPHGRAVEGTFVFPLPEGASVTKFTFEMDGKPVSGEILPAEKAKQVYLDIVRRMRDPALLEYSGGGMFTARLFPVPPGKTSQISLEVLQNLSVDNNLVRYFHNVRVGRGTPPAKGRLVIEGRIHSQVPIKSVFSPTHDLDVTRLDDHKAQFSCELSDRPYDRDFVLYYGVEETELGFHALTHRASGENGYFMLLTAPEVDGGGGTPEKDVVFVIDTSGSMKGDKMEQAKKALEYAVESLNPGDRFSVVSFATMARSMEEKLLPASKENLDRAKRFVRELEAVGGTALNDALVMACEVTERKGARPSYVLLFTDGRPTVGERDEARIVKNVGQANGKDEERRSRIFLMGVGYDVNARLLDLVAENNGGTTGYVRPQEDLELAISGLVDKIGHPVLTDVEMRFEGAKVEDVQPVKLPDLFRGEQLSVVGRYTEPGQAGVRLTGVLAGSEREAWQWTLDLPTRQEENDFLPRLWATRQVGYLLDQIRLHGEDEELKKEIVRLALKFGIVTPYTSYLVAEEEPGLVAAGVAVRAAMGPYGPGGPAGAFAVPTAPAMERARQGLGGAGTGELAVDAATATAAMRQADRAGAGVVAAETMRQVGGKTFYLDAQTGYWIDSDYAEDLEQVCVRYLGDVYLRLCAERPEVARWLAVGERVKLRVGKVGLVVAPDVTENLTDDQIETLGR